MTYKTVGGLPSSPQLQLWPHPLAFVLSFILPQRHWFSWNILSILLPQMLCILGWFCLIHSSPRYSNHLLLHIFSLGWNLPSQWNLPWSLLKLKLHLAWQFHLLSLYFLHNPYQYLTYYAFYLFVFFIFNSTRARIFVNLFILSLGSRLCLAHRLLSNTVMWMNKWIYIA